MTTLEDNAAVMALEYLRDYCHRQQCGQSCPIIRFCRILWDDDEWDRLEDAVENFIK